VRIGLSKLANSDLTGDHVCRLLGYHDNSRIGITGYDARHDGCVDDTQASNATDPAANTQDEPFLVKSSSSLATQLTALRRPLVVLHENDICFNYFTSYADQRTHARTKDLHDQIQETGKCRHNAMFVQGLGITEK
jgi:hypothetical protein